MKKTIRIIDLLNMISKGEEVPKKIKYDDNVMFYSIHDKDYLVYSDDEYIGLINNCEVSRVLNDEVEILDEEEFEDIKSFGIHYSWDYIDYKNIEELKKYVNKDFQNIFDTLDKLIKNQKILIEKLNKNNNTQ